MNVIQAWVLISLIGLILSLYLAYDSRRDLVALGKAKLTNGRRALAWTWLIADLIFAAVHLGYLAIGLLLLDREVAVSGTVVVLVCGNLGMMAVSLLNVRIRYLLYRTRNDEPPIAKAGSDS